MGEIILLDKTKADTLIALGFHCNEQKSSDGKIMYKFIDTPEIRKVVLCQFAQNDFCISKTICF